MKRFKTFIRPYLKSMLEWTHPSPKQWAPSMEYQSERYRIWFEKCKVQETTYHTRIQDVPRHKILIGMRIEDTYPQTMHGVGTLTSIDECGYGTIHYDNGSIESGFGFYGFYYLHVGYEKHCSTPYWVKHWKGDHVGCAHE